MEEDMKKLNKLFGILTVLVLVFSSMSVFGDGMNPNPRPFWGNFAGEVEFPVNGECLSVPGSGAPFQTVAVTEGKMTHMGRSELFTAHCATPDGGAALDGHAVFTAANGDEVFAEYFAVTVQPPVPPMFIIGQEITMVINGGTGRFEGATGSLEGMVYIEFQGFEDPSWPLEFVLSGWIVY
jgi:hypothetical protein